MVSFIYDLLQSGDRLFAMIHDKLPAGKSGSNGIEFP